MVESFRVLDAHGAARFERATSAALSKISNTSSKPSPVVAMRLEPTTKRVYRMASPSLRSTVTRPNFAAWWTKSATLALQISFLLGRQLTFGHAPPIHRRSTTAVRCPDPARCQARLLPLLPLPRMRTSYSSGRGMLGLPVPVPLKTRTDHVARPDD